MDLHPPAPSWRSTGDVNPCSPKQSHPCCQLVCLWFLQKHISIPVCVSLFILVLFSFLFTFHSYVLVLSLFPFCTFCVSLLSPHFLLFPFCHQRMCCCHCWIDFLHSCLCFTLSPYFVLFLFCHCFPFVLFCGHCRMCCHHRMGFFMLCSHHRICFQCHWMGSFMLCSCFVVKFVVLLVVVTL